MKLAWCELEQLLLLQFFGGISVAKVAGVTDIDHASFAVAVSEAESGGVVTGADKEHVVVCCWHYCHHNLIMFLHTPLTLDPILSMPHYLLQIHSLFDFFIFQHDC